MASTTSVLERMIAAMNRGGDAGSKASSGLDPQGSGQAHLRVRGSLDPASGMLRFSDARSSAAIASFSHM
jgi:hypothetical protein